MATFSFDIVSEYDKAEMNNVFQQVEREIGNRYDFKGTPAGIEWLADKKGLKLIGSNEWQIDAVLDIVRKKLAALIREAHPKTKPQIQGEAVRVTSASKDELQAVMQLVRGADLDFVTNFTNYR